MYMFLTIRNVAKYRSLSSDLHFNTTPKHLAALWNPTCGMLPSPLVPAQAAWGFVQVGVEHLQGGRILQPPWACCSFQCSTTLSAKQKITASHQNLSCFNTSVLPLPTSGKTWAPSSPHPPSIAAPGRFSLNHLSLGLNKHSSHSSSPLSETPATQYLGSPPLALN